MIQKFALAGVLAASLATAADATVVGAFDGPDNSFSINVSVNNLGPQSITRLDFDGTTATSGVVVWDSFGSYSGTAIVGSTLGVDTSIVSVLFNSFGAGDLFRATGIDPDTVGDPSAGLTPTDLIGVTLRAYLSNNTVLSGAFVDDPSPGAGIYVELQPSAVPLPASALLLLAGLGGIAALRRRKAA